MCDMLTGTIADKQSPFATVLMDTWYATKDLMLFVESLGKICYCPIRDNQLVNDSNANAPYRAASALQLSAQDLSDGKTIKIKSFPKNHKVKLFWVVVSTDRTDWIATNDLA